MSNRLTPQFLAAYQQLNPVQLQAVDTIEGPVMVVAGPGTGKTQVLAVRIANILTKTDTPASAILGLTFTESGAKAMRERLVQLIGPDGYYVTIATFHAFCASIIQEHPDQFAISDESEPLSDLERIHVFTQIIDENKFVHLKPLNAPHLYVKSLIRTIQELKREGYSPGDFRAFLSSPRSRLSFPRRRESMVEDSPSDEVKTNESKNIPTMNRRLRGDDGVQRDNVDKQQAKLLEVAHVFELYEEKLAALDRYDYEDMINKVNTVLAKNQELLRTYQERYHYFLADEYQDTNSAQNKLLFQLAEFWGQQANIFVVGDPDQAIYRFQGASLENVLTFKEKYPSAQVIQLNYNYRSQQTVLDAAHSLIQHNALKGGDILKGSDICHAELVSASAEARQQALKQVQDDTKKRHISSQIPAALISQTDFPNRKIQTAVLPSPIVENFFIGHTIQKLIADGVPANEIAIVYRDNSDANDIADMLGRMKIKYNLEGGDNVLHAGDITRLLTILATIVKLRTKAEDLDLFTIMNYEFFGIDPLDALKLARFASEHKINFLEAIYHPDITKAELVNLDAVKQTIANLQSWGQRDTALSFVETFEIIINESGMLNWLLSRPDAIRRMNRLNSLFREVKQFNAADHRLNIEKFLYSIQLMEANRLAIVEDDLNIDVDAVRLSTAHKIKGKEFRYVFIAKAYDTKWGNRRIPDLIKLPPELLTHSDFSKKEKNEDERRLFYVALTRAKEICYVSWAQAYTNKQVVPVMFLAEIPPDYQEEVNTKELQTGVGEILKDVFTPIHSEIASPEKKEFFKKVLENFKLSPTALNTYLECPYKFMLHELLRTPTAKPPAMTYGSAVHRALEKFFWLYKQTGQLPSIHYLLEQFEEALAKEIMTLQQKESWQPRGEAALRLYYKYYYDEHQPPVMVERFFGGKFNPVHLDDIPLSGKIDKVELVTPGQTPPTPSSSEEGAYSPSLRKRGLGGVNEDVTGNLPQTGKQTVRVVDYKTGSPKTRNEILGQTKYSDGGYKRQLDFYKLLSELDRSFPYEVVETQLDFVEAGESGKLKKETFTISQDEVGQLKTLIRETMAKIRTLEFLRTTNYRVCEYCDFKKHCWPDGIPQNQEMKGQQLELV